MNIFLYFVAFLLDLIFKDVELWPHPVRFIGELLNKLELIFRNQDKISLKIAGIFSLIISCMVVGGVVFSLTSLPFLGVVLSLYFAYAGLSLGGLIEKGREVIDLCKKNNIDGAREKLSYLVSRETSNMDEKEILKTLSETLSENINDGFFAPFFYLLIGGPVLLWIYKTVSTMDSMWGYKNDRWRELGWAGAKMDDIFGYIPARISFWCMFLFYFIKTRDIHFYKKVKLAIEDAKKMESPNAGWPMAACGIIFDCEMGGRAIYFGKTKIKPKIGGQKNWSLYDVEKLLDFLLLCGVFSCVLLLSIRALL
ncbi:adenosylcobinamide-phosphate synthase CbiB [Desulfothermus sp.]